MTTCTSYNSEIESYYRKSAWLYKYFWYSRKSLGLHHGLWGKNTTSHDQSITNSYRFIIDAAHISKNMNILDVGCGVGGAVFHIASHTKAHVTGISIANNQIVEAKMLAKKSPIKSNVTFFVGDYTDSHLPSQSFDCIYGIESICYAYPKRAFLTEAYRLLKPNGTLIIIDGYCKRKPGTTQEKNMLDTLCKAYRLKELIEIHSMVKDVKKSGFHIRSVDNLTPLIHKSLERMKLLVHLGSPFVLLSRIIQTPFISSIADNTLAMRMSIEGVHKKLFGYYAIVATKSASNY